MPGIIRSKQQISTSCNVNIKNGLSTTFIKVLIVGYKNKRALFQFPSKPKSLNGFSNYIL